VGYTTYVNNATYDAAGRSDILNLGLNPDTSNACMYLDYNYYAWDVQGGRLQWLQAAQTGSLALLQKLEYAYDAAGNVDWIKDYLAGIPYQLQDYTYDLLNRLDAASATGGDGQGLYNENYDYDSQGNLWKKGTVGSETVYTYMDSNHKHAVTHLGGAPMYGYDPNGNMTTRKVGATTYTQGWDAENRLVTVSGTGVSASFSYDGDGVRVKGTVNGAVTAYVSNWFEWTGSTSTMKKYYYAGAQRIAMRSGSGTSTSGLLWIIGDHLGSTTKIANYDGTLNSQRRYKPWGEARFGVTLPTTFAFTGQRQEVQLGGTDGLYYYGTRWYDAALGRWLSPDSIIPEAAQGVQAWSRYTYVNNAPINHDDPSGHCIDGITTAVCIAVAAGAVVGGIASAAGYIAATKLTGASIDPKSLAVAVGGGMVAGALAPLIAVTAPAATVIPATLFMYGTVSASQYAADQILHEQPVDATTAIANFGVGAATGVIGGTYTPFDEIGREGMAQGLTRGMSISGQSIFKSEIEAGKQFLSYQAVNATVNFFRTGAATLVQTLVQ